MELCVGDEVYRRPWGWGLKMGLVPLEEEEAQCWDRLGPRSLCNAVTLAPRRFSSKKIQKLYGTKNHCIHEQLGQILDKRYENKQPNCHFWTAWSKSRGLNKFKNMADAPCTQHYLRVSKPPKQPLLPNTQAHPLHQGSQWNLAWTFCLASG